MATSPITPVYPFDPTGNKSSNKITGEQQILEGSNPRDYYFIVPQVSPFFEDGLSISFKDLSGIPRILTKNVDYYCTHLFLEASYSTAKPIYGSITFLNTALVGIVTLSYQTVGGGWVPNNNVIAAILADRLNNPRTTSWEMVANLPIAFPPIAHEYDLLDMKGMDDVVAAVDRVTDAITSKSGIDLAAHKADMANPHATTATAVGAYTKVEADANQTQMIAAAFAAHIAQYH